MMRIHPSDLRPPSLLDPRAPDMASIGGGAVTTFLAHVLLPAILAAVGVVFNAIAPEDEAPKRPLEELKVIEARFVQLGKELPPNKLPNRQVPIKSTAPPEPAVVSNNPVKAEPQTKNEPRPKDAEDDFMRRLGDRAQQFAEIAERREREGSPDGIEEGTSREARAGDLYAGQLYALFRRGWGVPTIISDAEKRRLTVEIELDIGRDMRIRGFRVRRASGNALFDQSALDRIQEVVDTNTALPQPPPEIAHQYVGQTIALRFQGKDAS